MFLGAYAFSVQPFSILDEEETGAFGPATLYASNTGFISGASDTPASTYFDSTLDVPLRYERSLLNGSEIGGAAAIGWGDIELLNTDGQYDSVVANYSVDGRTVTVKLGSDEFAYADFGTIFSGTAIGWSVDEDRVRLRIRDKTYKLETQLQPNTYSGAGGVNGNADVQGRPKPLCYGECLNVTAVLVDPSNLIYQVHDGQIQAIDAVYDRGAQLTPGVGYTTDLTNGRFTLLAAPAGLITCDVKGSKTGGAYINTTSDIIKRVVKDQGGLTDSDLDPTSLSALNTSQPAIVGAYFPEPILITEALTQLIVGIGGWYGFSRAGTLQVAVFGNASGVSAQSFSEAEIINIEKLVLPEQVNPAVWRWRIGYQRNWTLQDSDLAGSVSAARRTFLANEYRIATDSDTFVKTKHLLARDPEMVPGLFASSTDALTEATRRLNLWRETRSLYRVLLKTQPFVLDLGNVVTLTYPRWDLINGRQGRICGVREDATTNEVELTVFV